MINAEQIGRMSRKDLAALLREGHAIDPDTLADTEYKGISLGLPSLLEKLSWKTFKKVFYRDPESGKLRGWNVRIDQRDGGYGYRPLMRDGEPFPFGHYQVVAPSSVPPGVDRGLLIHYGLGQNKPLDPVARLRDPIVAVNAGSSELLLGWSYLDLGFTHVGTPSFFSLQRDIPLSHTATPPGARSS